MNKKTSIIILLLIFTTFLSKIMAENEEQTSYQPVDISTEGIPGFTYPTPEPIIKDWIASGSTDSIYHHAWNLWLAINKKTTEVYEGDTLLVWETWYSLDEILKIVNDPDTRYDDQRTRAAVQLPHQIMKFDHLTFETADDTIFESVKYSPSSANYAINNKIFLKSKLYAMWQNGEQVIFPDAAMNIKPVFKIISDHNLDESGLFTFKAWTGPPAIDTIPFPQSKWIGCVYVNPIAGAKGAGTVDNTCSNPSPENTYYLDDFIYYRIDSSNVTTLIEEFGFKCEVGDYAILVGMHMTTREITRWTWETFWWTPDPMAPAFPALAESTTTRPEGLTGAAAHYTVSTAFQMLMPAQPHTGGTNFGDILYSYNPYLEPPFDSKVLNNYGLNFAEVILPEGQTVLNNVGVRTNCMSCHAQAHWAPDDVQISGLGYLGDTYIDMGTDSQQWDNILQADFAWSLADNVIDDLSDIDDIKISKPSWSYYPNPASRKINFILKEKPINPVLQIFTISGKLALSHKIVDVVAFQINVEAFDRGVYLIKLNNQTQKLVIR